MRTLVLQLARFGDIYQTWPSLQALRRLRPDAEFHILVRSRFSEALSGLDGWRVHEWPTGEILAPVLTAGDEAAALERLNRRVDELAALNFDEIINLSFSSFSSHLVACIAGPSTRVRGYTRHADGFLAIPDDPSAYFHAQVGVGSANRYHLTEIFAAVCGVELNDADFGPAVAESSNRVLLHLGASQIGKTYPPSQWAEVARELVTTTEVALIGSAEEANLAAEVCAIVPEVCNLTGKTRLPELRRLLAGSRLLIGGDSAPVHIAALTQTPVLNLSCPAVNFWETGPLTPGSRVLMGATPGAIAPETVAREARAMLAGEGPEAPCFERVTRSTPYRAHGLDAESFSWSLIQALYTGTAYPPAPNATVTLAFRRLFELSELALEQIARWNTPAQATSARVLASIDRLLDEIPAQCPEVKPAVQWFQTQRVRLPPAPAAETLSQTRRLFEELLLVCSVYRRADGAEAEPLKAAKLCAVCAPELREWNFAAIEPQFQELVSTLHELARHSSSLAGARWSTILEVLHDFLKAQEFIALADLLEYQLQPALNELRPAALSGDAAEML